MTKYLLVCLFVVIVGGLLDSLGGYRWKFCRRYIMPVLLGLGVSYVVGFWWAGLLCLPAMGTLSLGYPGAGNNGQRGLWLWVQAVSLSIGLFLFSKIWGFNFLTWYFFVGYILGAGVLGGIYKNWQQWKGDLISGAYLCSVIVLVWLTTRYGL